MDKIDEEKRDAILSNKKEKFKSKAGNFEINIYQTSIWEISLYKAFSNILSSIVKNNEKISQILEGYAKACDADEVILFDKTTLLVISSYNNKEFKDEERFEKICHSIKKFESNYKTISNHFNDFILKNKVNTIYFNHFNNCTYIMIVLSNKNSSLELVKLNIEIIKKEFGNI